MKSERAGEGASLREEKLEIQEPILQQKRNSQRYNSSTRHSQNEPCKVLLATPFQPHQHSFILNPDALQKANLFASQE